MYLDRACVSVMNQQHQHHNTNAPLPPPLPPALLRPDTTERDGGQEESELCEHSYPVVDGLNTDS